MEQVLCRAADGHNPPPVRSVNAARQLINGWARQRVSVTLSSTVGQLLNGLQLTLADLLLDEETLCARLGKQRQPAPDGQQIFPKLARLSQDAKSRQRLDSLVGTFRYRTRLKDAPMFVLERLLQFEAGDGEGTAVKVFENLRVTNKAFAEGNCFYHQSMFFVAVECVDPPHQPMIYA